MFFVGSARQALAFLKKESCDVIISDMMMPDISGIELFEIVRSKYPKMVRIILSGYADQGLAMQSVKLVHQYLAKPCEKDALVRAVTRSFFLQDTLSQTPLLTLLGSLGTIPSLPGLYGQVMEALRSGQVGMADIGNLIARDMGMSAKVLQLVNSSFFGMPRHIAGVREAVVMLGGDVVKALVLVAEVFQELSSNAAAVFPVDKIQIHCVRTGAIAKEVARLEGFGKDAIDNAVIASVLHDLGKLILMHHFSDEYRKVIETAQTKKLPLYEAENMVFGVGHAEVGAYILNLWGLPDDIIEAIAFHHRPMDCICPRFNLCGVVHVSELMEYHEQFQPGAWEKLNHVSQAYLEKNGVAGRVLKWRDHIRHLKQTSGSRRP